MIQPGCDARVQLLLRITHWVEASSYVNTGTCTGRVMTRWGSNAVFLEPLVSNLPVKR